ncbi:MAP kinase kinase kinase [Marasmius tenuissimus]|uniref:MAP kinase kinase kinase n=1 Tax=Marasmius tenuissimus TaxID=585030 RepID=A0ABR2ZIF9_9AGAR
MNSESFSAYPPPTCPIKSVDDLRKILSLPKPVDHLIQLNPSFASFVVELLYTVCAHLYPSNGASFIMGYAATKELQSSNLEDGYRRRCMKCLKFLVKKFQTLPSSLFLHNIKLDGTHPLTGGGFADIYRGTFSGQQVCLKVLRVHTAESARKREKLKADFCQEALLWTQLRHPNLLPLLGVNTDLFSQRLCLVSPWMKHGDIISFLKKNHSHERVRVLYEIVSGMQYLHSLSPPIAHGDIKGANILVDGQHHCLLADFGLADFAAETTIMPGGSSGVMKGSIRWMAPEVYSSAMGPEENTKENGPKEDKTPRDIYAFACTVLEIMTGKLPFHKIIDAAVIYQVSVRRQRPERPSEGWCPDHIWDLVELCWDEDPLRRPTAKALQDYLRRLIEAGNPSPGDSSFIGYFRPDNLDLSPTTSVSEISVDDAPTAGPSQPPDHDHLHSNLPRDFDPTHTAETLRDDIPPPSPTNARYVALFFQENEQQIDDAVTNTSFSSPSLQRCMNNEKEFIRVALDALRKASPVFMKALDVLSGVHPALGVTVIAYKMNIAFFYGHNRFARSIVTLMIRIQETMALLLRLPKLSRPEERSADGLTIWDRLQGLLVGITADIESAGNLIEESLDRWSGKPESDLDEKFIGWQYAIEQAFSYYSPSPNVETAILDTAIPRHANGWVLVDQDTYMNNLVAQFQNDSEDDTPNSEDFGYGWGGSGDWGPPGSPDPDSWQARPSNLFAEVLGKSQSSHPSDYHLSERSTPPGSSWHDPSPPTSDSDVVDPLDDYIEEPHLLGQSSMTSRSVASSVPAGRSSYPTPYPAPIHTPEFPVGWFPNPTPQLTSSDTPEQLPRIKVHSWLKYARSDNQFALNFAAPSFDPRQQPKPPNAPIPGGIPLIHRQTLDVAVTQPVLTMMHLVFDENDFVQPCPIPPRLTLQGSPGGITVRQFLKYIFSFLNQPIGQSDWDRLDDRGRRTVSAAFYKRCDIGGIEAAGVKIVDYLGARTMFRDIVAVAEYTFQVEFKRK